MQQTESMKKLKVIISGGGTGGHIFPALAIARAIEKKVDQVEFLFVGPLFKCDNIDRFCDSISEGFITSIETEVFRDVNVALLG